MCIITIYTYTSLFFTIVSIVNRGLLLSVTLENSVNMKHVDSTVQ